jgi:cytidylate kinase
MSLITIRGPLGSGSPDIGRLVANRLHIDYVDREIIAEVAARLEREEQDVTEKEMPPSSLFGRIAKALERGYSSEIGVEGAYMPVWQIPLDDTRYLNTLESVIRELARSQSLVIQGRGSQFILRDYPRALHVLVAAPIGVRVKRVMEASKLDHETAKREIARFDNGIREFIKRYFKADAWDPVYYDLVVNTEHLSFQAAASIVVNTLSFKDGTLGGEGRTG